MRSTEDAIRLLIREEIARLNEAIKDTHGYEVGSREDVLWSRRGKMGGIPVKDNPFVGFYGAFEDWYNGGDKVKRWKKEIDVPGSLEGKTVRGVTDVYFNEGDHVIIPYLDGMGDAPWQDYTLPGVLTNMRSIPAKAEGVPGADDLDNIPLVTVQWRSGTRPYELQNLGLAFLVKVAGPSGNGAYEKAADYMSYWRESGRRGAAGGRGTGSTSAAAGPSRPSTLRRPGGVAPPAPPRPPALSKPDQMTPAELERWKAQMGLKSRE